MSTHVPHVIFLISLTLLTSKLYLEFECLLLKIYNFLGFLANVNNILHSENYAVLRGDSTESVE